MLSQKILGLFLIILLPFSTFSQPILKYFEIGKKKKHIQPAFSFVHITDIHIGEHDANGDYGTGGYFDELTGNEAGYSVLRLKKAINWINQNAEKEKIKLVMVTGDLTDSGEKSEFLKVKELLDELTIPYVPVIGNHDMWSYTHQQESTTPCGDSLLNEVFATHFKKLRTQFSAWNEGTRLTACKNPATHTLNFFQNYAFTFENHRFIIADFGTRVPAPKELLGVGPQADLHNFEGGTLPFLEKELKNNALPTFVFTHFPPIKLPINSHFAFDIWEKKRLTRTLTPYRRQLRAWFSGHLHRNTIYPIYGWRIGKRLFTCVETAANKKFEQGCLRLVKVW